MKIHENKNISQEEIRASAKALGQKVSETLRLTDKDRYQRFLMEYLHILYPDGIPEFSHYEGLLIELSCLLTDTDISSKLDEKYFKKNAGKILKRMITFFAALENHNELQKYMVWYNLENFSGGMKLDDLENMRIWFTT